jgi:hypothetical protein
VLQLIPFDRVAKNDLTHCPPFMICSLKLEHKNSIGALLEFHREVVNRSIPAFQVQVYHVEGKLSELAHYGFLIQSFQKVGFVLTVREAVVFFREKFVDRPFCITDLPHCIVS